MSLAISLFLSAVPATAQESVVYLLRFPPGTEALVPSGAQYLGGYWYRAELSPQVVQSLSVYGVYAELDATVAIAANDPYYQYATSTSRFGAQRQWWLDKVYAPEAWDVAVGSGIRVAILEFQSLSRDSQRLDRPRRDRMPGSFRGFNPSVGIPSVWTI
ncbi:MAG: hypothetical protein NZ821_08540, partial [Gloeomargarita sp. SKYB31]|nr:hypothetical protein [Gloeomargarita sp. SKYB31]